MRISIFAKLALTFLVIVAGLVAFLAVSAARELEQSFAELVEEREDSVASGIGIEVDRVLSGLESQLKGMAGNVDFRSSLVDRLAQSTPPDELIARLGEFRDIAGLEFLWLVSADGTLLAAGHDRNVFGDNLLDPPGTYSDSVSRAIAGETVSLAGVETISARSIFVAEVFVPVTMMDRFLGTERVDAVLWGAREFDTAFMKRAADLAGAEIVAVAPGTEPLRSWEETGDSDDSELITALASGRPRITLRGGSYQLATIPFPRSIADVEHDPVSLHLLIPESDLLSRGRALLRAILLPAVLGGIVAILLAFLISKTITLPIERLKTAVTALSSGDLSKRVEAHSRDEVEDLVRSFNIMADELDANTRRLVEAEKLSAWREVARRLAHEIKNPLSPIKLSIQNLNRVYRGNPDDFESTLGETSETILEEVDRLRLLADEFSNFARMPKPVLSPNDICDIVRGSVALFDKPDSGAPIEFTCPDHPLVVNLDRDAMSRVITNLIKNAVEAMADREGRIRVSVASIEQTTPPWVRVTVSDDGVGMDEESLKHSFNPYFTTKRGGSGLGLAIVQSIVSEHRGRIRISSEPGVGTTVTVEIPATS